MDRRRPAASPGVPRWRDDKKPRSASALPNGGMAEWRNYRITEPKKVGRPKLEPPSRAADAADPRPSDPRERDSATRERGVIQGRSVPLQLTNLKKVFWPAEGYTKGDLIEYYRGVSPWLLPYLRDRPVVLTRFPDGIEGKSFLSRRMRQTSYRIGFGSVPIWSEDTGRDIKYFVCDDLDSLLYIANMGRSRSHLWLSSALAGAP